MQRAAYRPIPVKAKTHAVFALVSPEDFERLARCRWHLHRHGYAVRYGRRCEGSVLMHREILGLTQGDGLECDHINRDKLDNRRSNLRIVSHAVNTRNVGANADTTSRHRGVFWSRHDSHWRAVAVLAGVKYGLGCHQDEDVAAAAVNAFWASRGYAAPNDLAA